MNIELVDALIKDHEEGRFEDTEAFITATLDEAFEVLVIKRKKGIFLVTLEDFDDGYEGSGRSIEDALYEALLGAAFYNAEEEE